MSEFLVGKGYQVFGLVRGQNNPKTQVVLEENPALEIVEGDLRDLSSLIAAVEQVQPDEVYNLGAMSFVALSFRQPELTADITGIGVLRMLEAIRIVGGAENNPIRFYQASSSEMFGKVRADAPDRADAVPPALAVRRRQGVRPLHHAELPRVVRDPRARRASASTTKANGAASSSSPARSPTGSRGSSSGSRRPSPSGNLDSARDWGYAGDFVEAMWLMLQQDEPDDYVIATGETHTIREFLDVAFRCAGIDDWTPYVEQDPRFMRPGRSRPAHG